MRMLSAAGRGPPRPGPGSRPPHQPHHRTLLKAYFPQVLQWFRDKETAVFADFVERWPTLAAAQRARRETLVAFFHAHNVRKQPSSSDASRPSAPSARSPPTRPSSSPPALMVDSLAAAAARPVRWPSPASTTRSRGSAASLPDHKLFAVLPGAGPVFSRRACSPPSESAASASPTPPRSRSYAGIAPVTERSGNKHWVHWRWACPKFLRQSFVEWAAETVARSFWARAFYDSHRAKGASHNATIRALAFKWIRILFRCWVDRTPYDESRYLLALQKRHSPLLKFAAQPPA